MQQTCRNQDSLKTLQINSTQQVLISVKNAIQLMYIHTKHHIALGLHVIIIPLPMYLCQMTTESWFPQPVEQLWPDSILRQFWRRSLPNCHTPLRMWWPSSVVGMGLIWKLFSSGRKHITFNFSTILSNAILIHHLYHLSSK
jgi:hypothetical protein